MTEIRFVITKVSISASKVEKVSVIHPRKVAVSASRVYINPFGLVKFAQVVRPVKFELTAFIVGVVIVVFDLPVILPEVIEPTLRLVDVVSDACLVSNDDSIAKIFVETFLVPYSKVAALMVEPVRAIIFPQSIVPTDILLVEFKLVPPVEEIVLFEIVMLLPGTNVDCLLFKLVSILEIFVPTFVLP